MGVIATEAQAWSPLKRQRQRQRQGDKYTTLIARQPVQQVQPPSLEASPDMAVTLIGMAMARPASNRDGGIHHVSSSRRERRV